jgi:hypothetical protein
MLALDAGRYGSDNAVGVSAPSHIRVRVIEGLHRVGWLDIDVKPRSAFEVANR